MFSMRRVRGIFQWLMKAIVYAMFGLQVTMHYWFLKCMLAWQIRRMEGKRTDQGSEGFPQNKSIFHVSSTSEILDFKLHRSKTYIDQITFGRLAEIGKFACRKQKVPLISSFLLRHVLFNTMFSYGLKEEKDSKSEISWRFSFKEMGRYAILRKFSWDVSEILVLKSGFLKIVDSSGKIHTQYCKTWPLAKAHAQVQLTLLAPGMIHNLDHLVLSSVFASEVRKNLSKNSTLRRLLEKHTRFTQVMNNIEWNDIMNSSGSRNEIGRFMRPWMDAPVDAEHATTEMQRKCESLYFRKSSLIPYLNEDIPYQSFLKDYYGIFRDFVIDLAPYLEEDYEVLRKSIAKHLPGVAKHDMTDVLSAVLWNCSIVHTSDHDTYLKKWARLYGCIAIRVPLVKPKKTDAINIRTVSDGKIDGEHLMSVTQNEREENHVTINIEQRYSLEEYGSKFFRSVDIFRTNCFLRTYVQYNPSPSIDMALFNTEYGFTDPEATAKADIFLMNIKDLSSMLKQRGEAIVKGDQFLQSVCF